MSNVSVISTTALLDGGIGDDSGDAAVESDGVLRRLVLSYPGPVVAVHTRTGVVVHESAAAKSLLGVDPQIEPHRRMQCHFASPTDYSTIMGRLSVDSEVTEVELELSRMDGTTFWASISASIIEYRSDALSIFNIVDISRYKNAEQRIARQSESLHQSEKLAALGSLLAGVAHELNNPLSVVSAQAVLLQDTASDPRLIERATKIGNAADRCSRIVRTFLSMARQRPLDHGAVNINEIVDAVVSVTNYSLRKSNIELTLDLASDLPRVWANDDELNQVVTNLVVNAQQAIAGCRDSGNLRIASAYDDVEHRVLLSISDDGPGVPHDIRSRIFEPFFTTKEVGEGTGIGLAVCHRIMESLRGKIGLESHAGQGASFTISLPAIPEEPATALVRVDSPAKPEARRVLVVDNEPEITSMLKEILTLDGHEVRCASSGEKALKLLARQDFHIILTDLRMPNMDGIGLYQTLARLTPRLLDRVGFITGDTFSPSAREFLRQTESPHIEKPFTPEQVRGLVEELQSRTRFGALLK
jgi:signal transduction histidine kinase/CheY-like chemotaxis protein